ncbi:MAG TPA: 16S rRNA (guanine(527)-N(7))-methyltransferase RsmG [Caulobacteraceae bacterium]
MCAASAGLDEGAAAGRSFVAGVGANPVHRDALEAFEAMVSETNATMNLVGPSTLSQFWNRHVIDSAQLLWFAPGARIWADLGAGAGLPGIVLAILLKETPGARVHLIESRTKRCEFLARVADELALPVEVHNVRAETLSLAVEVVTARACAPLTRLLGYAKPYLAAGARGLFLKGRDVGAEIAEARKHWRLTCKTHPSLSDPGGAIVDISERSLA